MNKFIKIFIDKLNKKFKEELKRQEEFFSKPKALISLNIIALQFFKGLTKEKKSKKEIKDFLQKDNITREILKYTSNNLDEDNISNILLSCLNDQEEINIIELAEDITPDNILSYADKINDIDKKTNSNRIKSLERKIFNNYDAVISYGFMLYYIIDITVDLIKKTEYPSKYRTKYIQKLIRNTYALMKNEYNKTKGNVKKEYDRILKALKQTDDILIALTLVTSLYIINRRKLVKLSKESLKESSTDMICSDVPEPFDVSINKIPFQMNLNCPTVIDDVIVPHIPIFEKMKDISCEVIQNEQITPNVNEAIDLITHAIIRNSSKKILTTTVTKNSYLTPELAIANLDGRVIYSPVNGYVEELNSSEIVLRDISDPEEDYLSKQINLLNEKYERLNSVNSFLKYYYVRTLYPSMLATAIVDDSSTYDTHSGVEKLWKDIKKDYEKIDKEYEKQIKKITGKDNVEENAKNETLYKIKDQIEKQQEVFYKHLLLLGEVGINESKKYKAKSNEYELFEFYSLDLGASFNKLDNPDKIETEFRDQINEFIRRRVVIDGYKKSKLEKKINEQIKDIEKSISTGNWFDQAMMIYSTKKQLSDVKSWLMGLANENKKLEGTEKIYAVNKVMFLFEFYLNMDQIVEKYNILKKETTPKLETIKEGNWIFAFTQNLWKEYKELPKQIEEIENLIDSLSMFSTYSIIDWNGYQTRLYTITDKPVCESKETNPYLNPKSEYGFGDIQYWLKYCSYATLTSVTNPALGWSTGWIFPTPILFPVVYIPIKPISTKFGFIVLGISICGIYIFPWVLLTNLSTKYTTPFGDPTVLLKKEIDVLKKSISEQLISLRKTTVKPMLDKTKTDIENTKKEIEVLETNVQKNKESKPSKYATDKSGSFILDAERGIKQNVDYANQYRNWIKKTTEAEELLITAKTKLWKYEATGTILQEAYTYGKSLKGADVKSFEIEKFINKQIDQLSTMTDNIDKVISVLPIALTPETANFGITIKNPKPIIKIKGDLDNMINTLNLDKITDKFNLKNSDMMSTKYVDRLINSAVNSKLYKQALSTAMPSIIIQDAFPHYSLLKPSNIPWIMFLYKDFVQVGARTYGFPSQIPLPL